MKKILLTVILLFLFSFGLVSGQSLDVVFSEGVWDDEGTIKVNTDAPVTVDIYFNNSTPWNIQGSTNGFCVTFFTIHTYMPDPGMNNRQGELIAHYNKKQDYQ